MLGIAVSAAFDLSAHGVAIVGTVPSGLPSVSVPNIAASDIAPLMAAAAGMALVIFSESLGAAQNFAEKHGYEIDPDQELIALGVANAGSGFLGGLAGGGSLSQTAVNDGAGARSEVSPVVAAVLVLVTVLVLTPLFKDLPEAVLAALIIHAVVRLMKVGEFRVYYGQRRIEFWLGLATLLGVITLDVLPGLIIGVISMLLLVVYEASRPHLAVLGRVPTVAGAWGDVDRHPDYVGAPGLLVVRLEGPVFYANATLGRDRIKVLVGRAVPVPRAVILDVGANSDIDITTAAILDQLIRTLRAAGVDFALAEARGQVVDRVRRSEVAGLIALIGEDRIFHTIDEAVRALGEP